MTLNQIFSDYCNKMATLYLSHRSMKNLADEELERLSKLESSVKDKPELEIFSSSHHNMFFYAAKDGIIRMFAQKSSSVKDRIIATILHKNKQYQWLLVESYEAFEDFIEQVYAYLGILDHSLWPLSDFGNITLSELKSKSFDYYLSQSKSKKDLPHSILNKIRDICPDYAKLEISNMLNRNMKLIVILIEKLRHLIVHKGGVVHDRKAFIESVLQKTGIYNNGKYDNKLYGYINTFFGINEFNNIILLLEIPQLTDLPIRVEINRFEGLTGALMSTAHLIYEEIDKLSIGHLQKQPTSSVVQSIVGEMKNGFIANQKV